MRGEAVPQRMNADTLGDAGTSGDQANDPMQLARTGMLPAVAGKQPGLTRRHPALLARNAPPFMQYLEQDGRENDVPILLALALLDPDDHPVTIDIGELERYDLRGSQAGGISQAQERLVLDVRRRGEQSADLFRAENNGEAARLTGRHDALGKIGALQRNLEEEPQGSGTDVRGRYRRPDRRQPQLIAMDILGGGFVGRPTQKIGKLFDVADVLVLSLGIEPPDRHVLDQPPAYGTDGLLGHWGLLSWVWFSSPQSQDRTPVSRYSRNPSSCHQLPRERFSPSALLSHCARRPRVRAVAPHLPFAIPLGIGSNVWGSGRSCWPH